MDEIGFHRCLHRPGTLLDIGAHDGAFTLPFAALPASRVLAFEPLPAAFARLRPRPAARRTSRLRQEALGDASGEVTLSLPVVDGVPNEQWASTAKDYAGLAPRVAEQRCTVPLRRLDGFGLTDLTAVKLDAEGGEYEVLRGGRGHPAALPPRALDRDRGAPPPRLHLERAGLPRRARLRRGSGSIWGDWRPMASFDRATMQQASPDPTVFAASDPYVFVFYFLPREPAPAMLAARGPEPAADG